MNMKAMDEKNLKTLKRFNEIKTDFDSQLHELDESNFELAHAYVFMEEKGIFSEFWEHRDQFNEWLQDRELIENKNKTLRM